MADRAGKGVRGVERRREFSQFQEGLHHLLDLRLIRAAISHHGLLYLSRRILENRKVEVRRREKGNAPGMTELQRGLDILGEKDILDRHCVRLMPCNDFSQPFVHFLQAVGKRQAGRSRDAPGFHKKNPIPLFVHDSESARDASRVDTKDTH